MLGRGAATHLARSGGSWPEPPWAVVRAPPAEPGHLARANSGLGRGPEGRNARGQPHRAKPMVSCWHAIHKHTGSPRTRRGRVPGQPGEHHHFVELARGRVVVPRQEQPAQSVPAVGERACRGLPCPGSSPSRRLRSRHAHPKSWTSLSPSGMYFAASDAFTRWSWYSARPSKTQGDCS